MSGVTCDDFDQTVYDLAMDAVVSNSTFGEADCATTATGDDAAISVTSEVTMPLVLVARTYGEGSGESVQSHVARLLVEAVSTGAFTSSIQQFAADRRRRLADAAVAPRRAVGGAAAAGLLAAADAAPADAAPRRALSMASAEATSLSLIHI